MFVSKVVDSITGEIYMKYSKLGNDDIESFLLRQGMEPYSGGFVNYCLYLVDTERYKAEKYQHNSIMAKACAFVLQRLCKAQKHLLTVIGETDRFQTNLSFPELKEKVRGILQRLHARFPDVGIQAIEYDYDQSKTLRESRILLAISQMSGWQQVQNVVQ